jgi:hypothetical protein
MASRSLFLALASIAVVCAAAAPLTPKQLSGPPEEFSQHVIPDAADGGIASSTETYWVKLAPTAEGLQWASHIPIDSDSFEFAVFSSELASMTISLTAPNGADVPLANYKTDTDFPNGDFDESSDRDAAFLLPNMTPGIYTLSLTAPSGTNFNDQPAGYDAFVMFMPDSDDMLYTQIASYESLVQGQQVGPPEIR